MGKDTVTMDRWHREQARLACRISIGLMAGIFSIIPVVSASPVQDTSASAPKLGDFKVDQTTTANVTAVTSNDKNNIVPWTDFSVASGETVKFDDGNKTNNYLNVVTGSNASDINGAITGGNDVYIVNPHGVLFGASAKVEVGNLYVSTQEAQSAVDAFKGNKTGAKVITAGTAKADVVNLGSLNATNVQISGKNITFSGKASATATSGNIDLAASGDVVNLGTLSATSGNVNISGANINLWNDTDTWNDADTGTKYKSKIDAKAITLDATTNVENFGTMTATNDVTINAGTKIKLMDTADVSGTKVSLKVKAGTIRLGEQTSTGKGKYDTLPPTYETNGTIENFGVIKTKADLSQVATDTANGIAGNYEMANDVASSNTPIGDASHPFKGTFAGT